MTVSDKFYRDNINATKSFQWVPARGQIAQVQLLPNGRVVGSSVINGWNLRWVKGLFITLHLTQDDESVATLRLESTGEWKGRDRDNGHCVMRPRANLRSHWMDIQKKPVKPSSWKEQNDFHFQTVQTVDWSKVTTKIDRPVFAVDSRAAILLIGYDRPDYYEQTLKSIAQDPTAQTLSVYAFLDKPDKPEIQAEHAAITRMYFPHAELHLRQHNYGCGRNIIDARRYAFDERKHSQAFLFEDDCVVSKNYVTLMFRLMQWAQKNYDNIGAVQGWTPCLHTEETKRSRLRSVEGTFVNWWGYLITREAWDQIKETLYFFEDTFLLGSYSDRPHHIIRQWIDEYRGSYDQPALKGRCFPVTLHWHKRKVEHLTNIPAGQDGITQMMFALNNIVRLTTQVNRSRYIGAKGIHMSPMRYRLAGYGNVKLHEFEEDEGLKTFIPSNEWNPPSIMDGLIMARA